MGEINTCKGNKMKKNPTHPQPNHTCKCDSEKSTAIYVPRTSQCLAALVVEIRSPSNDPKIHDPTGNGTSGSHSVAKTVLAEIQISQLK